MFTVLQPVGKLSRLAAPARTGDAAVSARAGRELDFIELAA
jgi:hypothetical protein